MATLLYELYNTVNYYYYYYFVNYTLYEKTIYISTLYTRDNNIL